VSYLREFERETGKKENAMDKEIATPARGPLTERNRYKAALEAILATEQSDTTFGFEDKVKAIARDALLSSPSAAQPASVEQVPALATALPNASPPSWSKPEWAEYNEPNDPDSELIIDPEPPHRSITVGELNRRPAPSQEAPSAPEPCTCKRIVMSNHSVRWEDDLDCPVHFKQVEALPNASPPSWSKPEWTESPAIPQAESDEELSKGTFACDICGKPTPHYHDEQLVEIERFARPAFEQTTVRHGAFGRIAKNPDFPYSDAETERLWQHFISGWFASKTYSVILAPVDMERAQVAEWMVRNGIVTGHGDTLEDLLAAIRTSATASARFDEAKWWWNSANESPLKYRASEYDKQVRRIAELERALASQPTKGETN
jgi:hypothetical protein